VALNLVLTSDGEPVGMVSATAPGAKQEVELISLWDAQDFRGRGIGHEALCQMLAWVRREHPTSCVVSVNGQRPRQQVVWPPWIC
jgi:RimJ/RimL family protein N-acetyltransferase